VENHRCEFRTPDESVVLEYAALTGGRPHYIYPQHQLVQRLCDTLIEAGGQVRFEHTVRAMVCGKAGSPPSSTTRCSPAGSPTSTLASTLTDSPVALVRVVRLCSLCSAARFRPVQTKIRKLRGNQPWRST
jgi:hypothetical protein